MTSHLQPSPPLPQSPRKAMQTQNNLLLFSLTHKRTQVILHLPDDDACVRWGPDLLLRVFELLQRWSELVF